MKKAFFLILISVISISVRGQKSSLSIKAGITNCTTKSMLIPSTGQLRLGGYEPRTGGLSGIRYDRKLSKYFDTGIELLYLLKGNTLTVPVMKTYSNHYLNFSPFISVFPFANSENKYISCISPEISFDYNHFLGTNNIWESEGFKLYQYELGYSLKLTYQPKKFGVQLFYFKALSPYVSYHSKTVDMSDSKYSFVSGVSILYKIFPTGNDHKK